MTWCGGSRRGFCFGASAASSVGRADAPSPPPAVSSLDVRSLLAADRLPARGLPGPQPALDRRRLVPLLDELLRRTGARALGLSGAVGGDQLVFGQLGQVALELGHRDAQRALGVF